MSLKLSGLFCTPAVVHTSCFDYVLKATAWKMKTAYMFAMLVIWCKMQRKKLLQITVSLRKWIQLKVYSHPVKNVWISSLTFVLIFWWIELAIWRSHRKICQNFIFDYLGRKICIVNQTLIAFFHTEEPVSSQFLETSYNGGFYMLYVPNFMRPWLIVQTE